MKGGGLWLVPLALALMSCGLETVPSLNPPDVAYDNLLLNTDSSLSFVHSQTRYAGSDFVGYQIFYKIYPASSDFTRLLADRDLAKASQTISQLANLGYRSFTFSDSPEGSSAGTESLLVQNLADGVTVSLDFKDFLSAQATATTQPLLMVQGVPASKPYLYRTPALVGTNQQTFGALRSTAYVRNSTLPNNGLPLDLSSAITDQELLNKAFEINVFIAAYGITSSLVEVSSSPVPWGVIRTIQ